MERDSPEGRRGGRAEPHPGHAHHRHGAGVQSTTPSMLSTAVTPPTTLRSGASGASPDAAVALPAVLVGVLPSFGTPAQKVAASAIVEDAYLAALGRVSDASAKMSGVAVGRAAGAAMLALRKDDGALRDAPYTPGTGPGKWRPHPNPDRRTRPSRTRTRPRLCVFNAARLG